ncbi:MAG: DUF4184 family protein [Spartobacteria bacterium]
MPWTLSHPAIVLPLRRFSPRPLDFTALVVGSTTPDFGYYIERFDLSSFAHTLPGSFLACVPTGVLLLLLFYLVCRPISYALPSPHRQNLLPLCPRFPTGFSRWVVILISLLLGAWTHNFWDAFTHEHGWFVDRIPWLQQPFMQVGSTTIYRYLLMQELSTIVGFGVLVATYWSWLRSRPPTEDAPAGAERWRYLFWAAILVLSLVITLPVAVHYAVTASLRDVAFVRSILFRTAIYSPLVALPLTLLASGLIYHRRQD